MVDNIHLTIDLIIGHGGTLIQAMDINSQEKTATFTDPAGNIFGLYKQ